MGVYDRHEHCEPRSAARSDVNVDGSQCYHSPVERAVFSQRFRDASAVARDFARRYIEEPLPEPLLFRLRLNASFDGNPLHEDERVFPEDSDRQPARRLSRCTAEEVVDVLWRDAMVPEWVNLSVICDAGTATLVEVLACGRFTANDGLLYHQREGRAPFHVLGPSLPAGFEQGQKFSIYHRSACMNRDEFSLVAPNAAKVWSLELSGEDFDDEMIASLPAFPRLHVLALEDSPLRAPGLVGLRRQQSVRHLRIYVSQEAPFFARDLPTMPHIESFTIEGLPPGAWNFQAVTSFAANLRSLSIRSEHDLVLDARLRDPLESLTLHARSVIGDPLPANVRSLYLHLRESHDEDIARLLDRVESVTALGLRGTPVTDELIEWLVARWKLEFLDVVETRVGDECLRRICARNPKLRTFPNLAQ